MTRASDRVFSDLDRKAQIMRVLSEHAPVDIDGPVFSGPNALIYKATIDGGERQLAVKYCTGAETREGAEYAVSRQFDDLRVAWELMSQFRRYGVPKPILAEPAQRLLVMEWVDGISMFKSLRGCRDIEKLEQQFRSAGQWLSRFHASSASATHEFDFGSKLDEIRNSTSDKFGRLSSHLFLSNINFLELRIQQIKNKSTIRTKIHGDYQIANIIHNNDKIVVLDFSFLREENNLSDIITFMSFIDRLFISHKFLHLIHKKNRLYASFAEGYRSVLEFPDPDMLSWALLAESTRYFARKLAAAQNSAIATYLLATLAILSYQYRRSISASGVSHGA